MAKINPKDGKYELGDSKDSELEGVDGNKFDVFTEDTKLEEAKNKFNHVNWFVSFTIKDKGGKDVGKMPQYTMKLDRPDSETFELYYYLDGNLHSLRHDEAGTKGNKRRIKAYFEVGDPPTGSVP